MSEFCIVKEWPAWASGCHAQIDPGKSQAPQRQQLLPSGFIDGVI
jgi:hypothetical protein